MLLRLIRQAPHGQSVPGTLIEVNPITGNRTLCDTLENADHLIPELIYPVHVTHSPKFKRLLPIINYVPGRTGIRMHAGNRAAESEGCVLLGEAKGMRLVNSREAVDSVTTFLQSIDATHEEIRLDVTHWQPAFPAYPHTDYNPHNSATPDAHTVENND